jgi:hypothetical protein
VEKHDKLGIHLSEFNHRLEMVDVVQFTLRGSQQVADLGECIELIWTPAVDGFDILGIPALEAAPQHRISGFTRRRKRPTASS